MNVVPSAESVFTPEYWEPLPTRPEFKHDRGIARFIETIQESRKIAGPGKPTIEPQTRRAAQEALCLAVNQLLTGEIGEVIEEGEHIGGVGDQKYSLPGAVILTDTEHITFREPKELPENVIERIDTQQEADIGLSAASCLLRNMTSTNFEDPAEDYAILNHYSKTFWSEKGSVYIRSVQMYAFCLNKRGEVTSISLMQWRNEPDGPKAVPFDRWQNRSYFPTPPTVGEAIKDIWSFRYPGYIRIREARLCIVGKREAVNVRARQHQRSWLPRLALSPSHG